MSIRLTEVDISRPLPVITGLSGYSELWVLIRDHGSPLGYVRMKVASSEMGPEALAHEIGNQLGPDIARHDLYRRLTASIPSQWPYHPLISILICTRDRAGSLANTLDSLLLLDYPNYEVLVVDNAPSNDETRRLVAQYPFRYTVENHPGHSWARNTAIAESRGEIVAFMDDDMLADRQWLEATARAFADPDVDYVTGLVLPLELETQAQELFEVAYRGFSRGFKTRFLPADFAWAEGLQGLCHDTGPFMAFRREVFAKAGVFDTALGGKVGGAEDTDLLHRIIRAGFTLVYTPDAIRYHKHRETIDGLAKQIAGYGRSYTALLTKCLIHEPDIRRKLVRKMYGYYKCWCAQRIIRALFGRTEMPLRLVLAESIGAFQGPWAYLRARASKKAARLPVYGPSIESTGVSSNE